MDILLIDANNLFAGNFKEYFMLEGMNVFHPTNQNELLDILHNNNIDVIVIDVFLRLNYLNPPIKLPNEEFGSVGFYLLKLIEKFLVNKKVIITTTLEKEQIINGGFNCKNYLHKPVSLDEILDKIKNCCQACSIA